MDPKDILDSIQAATSLRPTFPSMWLANIREAMHRAGMPRPENHHTTATGSAIYFTDPEDGQRYRISVEPIKPEAEPKF